MTIADYLIVGAGSAGCVLANRLSADAACKVVLLEAGPDFAPGSEPDDILDGLAGRAYFNPRYTWTDLRVFLRSPDNEGAIPARRYEQARLMGGGSSINGMMANRGVPADYDGWETLGAQGWNWEEVLPYFKKLESDLDFDGDLHGHDGPIPIRRVGREHWPGFSRKAVEAFQSIGLQMAGDQNAHFHDATFPIAVSNVDDKRVSSAMGYLTTKVRKRPNLHIRAETEVNRLVFEGSRAVGVEVTGAQGPEIVRARTIILCAGAIGSPHLLMKSGVGEAQALKRLGIQVVADRAAVGQNLQDHPAVSVAGYLRPEARKKTPIRRQMFVAARYSSGVPGCDPQDMYVVVNNQAGWHPLGRRLGAMMVWINRTYSTGSVRLAAGEGGFKPLVDFNLLSDERDLIRLKEAVRLLARLYRETGLAEAVSHVFPASYNERVRDVGRVNALNWAKTAAFSAVLDALPSLQGRLIETIITEGVSLDRLLNDDLALTEWVKENAIGAWHASGTCRMGDAHDESCVVDPQCRVLGVDGLRVADASIMPFTPRANTNIPAIMIGEKLADILLTESGSNRSRVS